MEWFTNSDHSWDWPIYLSIDRSIDLSIYLSFLSTYLSIYLSIDRYIYLSYLV